MKRKSIRRASMCTCTARALRTHTLLHTYTCTCTLLYTCTLYMLHMKCMHTTKLHAHYMHMQPRR